MFSFYNDKSLDVIINEYETIFFNINHIITNVDLKKILINTIVYNYSLPEINKELGHKYYWSMALKYQFLLMKIDHKTILTQLLEKFEKNFGIDNNCVSNLIAEALVQYLAENPEELNRIKFSPHVVNILSLINPIYNDVNGKKIEWPTKFLDKVTKFMKSNICFSYIRSVDSIVNFKKNCFSINKLTSKNELGKHIDTLVYEYLKKKSYLYNGYSKELAKNIYNGVIVFNSANNFKKYMIFENKSNLAYLIILCVHELLHLKRILFNLDQKYTWRTPNLSPFREDMKYDVKAKYPEIGWSFEFLTFGILVDCSVVENENVCEVILNEELWKSSPEKMKNACKKAMNTKNKSIAKNCKLHKITTFEHEETFQHCSNFGLVEELISNMKKLRKEAKNI